MISNEVGVVAGRSDHLFDGHDAGPRGLQAYRTPVASLRAVAWEFACMPAPRSLHPTASHDLTDVVVMLCECTGPPGPIRRRGICACKANCCACRSLFLSSPRCAWPAAPCGRGSRHAQWRGSVGGAYGQVVASCARYCHIHGTWQVLTQRCCLRCVALIYHIRSVRIGPISESAHKYAAPTRKGYHLAFAGPAQHSAQRYIMKGWIDG